MRSIAGHRLWFCNVSPVASCSGGGGGSTPAPPPAPPQPPSTTITVTAVNGVSAPSVFAANCGVADGGTAYTNADVEPHIAINQRTRITSSPVGSKTAGAMAARRAPLWPPRSTADKRGHSSPWASICGGGTAVMAEISNAPRIHNVFAQRHGVPNVAWVHRRIARGGLVFGHAGVSLHGWRTHVGAIQPR